MKSVKKAYVLWLVSGFGWFGFHRFYMQKKKTAILWMCTFGFFGMGSLADLLLMKWLINRYNMIERIKELQMQLAEVAKQKKLFIKAYKLDEASIVREKEKPIEEEIKNLKNALPNAHQYNIG